MIRHEKNDPGRDGRERDRRTKLDRTARRLLVVIVLLSAMVLTLMLVQRGWPPIG